MLIVNEFICDPSGTCCFFFAAKPLCGASLLALNVIRLNQHEIHHEELRVEKGERAYDYHSRQLLVKSEATCFLYNVVIYAFSRL